MACRVCTTEKSTGCLLFCEIGAEKVMDVGDVVDWVLLGEVTVVRQRGEELVID